MELIDWQFYPKWHLSFKRHRYDFQGKSWWEYVIVIGPLQTRWWGKIWPQLIRSEQWLARVKEILLDDLTSQKYNNGRNP